MAIHSESDLESSQKNLVKPAAEIHQKMKHKIKIKCFRHGDVLTLPDIHPDSHTRLSNSLSIAFFKPIGFYVSSHSVGLKNFPNPTFNLNEPEKMCLGLCLNITSVPF